MNTLDLSAESPTLIDSNAPFNVILGWKSSNEFIEVDHFADDFKENETEIDSFAVLLEENESGQFAVHNTYDLVYYNNKQSSCKSVTLESAKPSKGNYKVDPSKLPDYVSKILFFIGAYDVKPEQGKNYLSGYVRVKQGSSTSEIDVEERVENVMAFGELTRVGSQWKMSTSSEKLSIDVYGTLLNFGINV